MKEKAAATFLKDAHGHTQRSARNKTHTKTQTRRRERKGGIILNKNINTVTTRNTTKQQQKSAVPGQTTGARAV